MTSLTLTQENFKQVIERNHLVIIDFWAPWCEPCVNFTPIFEQASANNQDLVFGTLNIDENPDIASFFNVTQIPCVISIKDQVVIDGIVGEMPLAALEKIISQLRQFNNLEINKHFEQQALLKA